MQALSIQGLKNLDHVDGIEPHEGCESGGRLFLFRMSKYAVPGPKISLVV